MQKALGKQYSSSVLFRLFYYFLNCLFWILLIILIIVLLLNIILIWRKLGRARMWRLCLLEQQPSSKQGPLLEGHWSGSNVQNFQSACEIARGVESSVHLGVKVFRIEPSLHFIWLYLFLKGILSLSWIQMTDQLRLLRSLAEKEFFINNYGTCTVLLREAFSVLQPWGLPEGVSGRSLLRRVRFMREWAIGRLCILIWICRLGHLCHVSLLLKARLACFRGTCGIPDSAVSIQLFLALDLLELVRQSHPVRKRVIQ